MSASGESYDGRMIRALVCLMFFTFAMTTDAVGSVIPAVIAEFSLSMTAASAFQYATMAGIAAGALLLGFLADRLGRKPTVIVGLALYGAASLVFAVSDRFGAFVMLLALSGLGISVFKIGALALVGDVSESTTSHTRFMNTIEGFFAVGAIVGPAVVATLIARGLSWKWLYVVAAAICVLLVAIAGRVRYPDTTKRAAERATLREMVSVVRDPVGARGLGSRDALRRRRGRRLRLDADVFVELRRLVRVAARLCAHAVLRAARRGPVPRRVAPRARVLDGRACDRRRGDLLVLSRLVVLRRRCCCVATAAFRALHVHRVPDAELEGDQLLSEVAARGGRRGDLVLHGSGRGARSARDGSDQRCLRHDRGRLRAGDGIRLLDARGARGQLAARSVRAPVAGLRPRRLWPRGARERRDLAARRRARADPAK